MLKKISVFYFPVLLLMGCHSLHKSRKCCKLKESPAGQALISPVSEQENTLSGQVYFEKTDKKTVQIKVHITGLEPNQNFGFHIHEFGDCSNKALQAGGHFNPENHKHGSPNDAKKHLGDLGNLQSDEEGTATYSSVLPGPLKVFFGRSVIVHEKADDLTSQPSGNSGSRIGCGIIGHVMGPAEPEQKTLKGSKPAPIKPEIPLNQSI